MPNPVTTILDRLVDADLPAATERVAIRLLRLTRWTLDGNGACTLTWRVAHNIIPPFWPKPILSVEEGGSGRRIRGRRSQSALLSLVGSVEWWDGSKRAQGCTAEHGGMHGGCIYERRR
jgi:hypothetical protein